MKRLLLVLAVVVELVTLGVLGASAQTQHFIISTNAAGAASGNGMQSAAVGAAGFQVTQNISVDYGRIGNPADTKQPIYNLGDFNYTRQLHDLLGAKLTSKLVFDTTNWLVVFQGSGGKVTGTGFNHVAVGAGLYLSRPVANNVAITTGYRVLHGAGTKLVKVPQIGLNFTF